MWHPSEVPESVWTLFDSEISVSPYTAPQWSRFWEHLWPGASSAVWLVGTHSGGAMALCAIVRPRWKWNWVFCQPYGTAGVFCTSGWDARDSQLLSDILTSIAGDRCLQVSLTGELPEVTVPRWSRRTHRHNSWVLDARSSDSGSFLSDLSENHRRNIEKGREAGFEVSMIYGPAEVERMQAQMRPARSRDSRFVMHRQHGPLFAEVFAGSRGFRWYAAWSEGRCAATCLWLVRGNHAVYVDGAVDLHLKSSGINHALFEHVLSDMHVLSVRVFDFGAGPRGKTSAGLARFKEGWGARPVQRQEQVFRAPLYGLLRRVI
jgi:hypothetical protein